MKRILWLILILTLLISSQSFAVPPMYCFDPLNPPAGDFTIDGDLIMTGSTGNQVILPQSNDPTNPAICFYGGSTCSGFWEVSDGAIGFGINENKYFELAVNQFRGAIGSAAVILNEAATSTNPTLIPNRANFGDGRGSGGAGIISDIAGGVEGERITETSREIEATTTVCVAATDNVNTTAVHALRVDDVVVFTAGTVCTGLTSGTNYYVESITDVNNFKVSATRGGAAIDLTDTGTAFTSAELEITENVYGDLVVADTLSTTPQSLTVTTEADITLMASLLLVTGDNDSDNDTIDLQNGSVAGQRLTIIGVALIDADDTITVAMTDTTCTGCLTVLMDEVGDTWGLVWTGSTWATVSNSEVP